MSENVGDSVKDHTFCWRVLGDLRGYSGLERSVMLKISVAQDLWLTGGQQYREDEMTELRV